MSPAAWKINSVITSPMMPPQMPRTTYKIILNVLAIRLAMTTGRTIFFIMNKEPIYLAGAAKIKIKDRSWE